jgi:hypothetical protein
MQVTRCQELSAAQTETVRSLTSLSFYCSEGFGRLWEAAGGTLVHWFVERDGKILAVLPGVEFGIRPVRRFQAMPDGCYGRLFVAGSADATIAEIRERLAQALKAAGYVKLFIYDYYDTLGPVGGFDVSTCSTTLVEIPSPDWQPPHESSRRAVRKADREGTSVRRYDHERDFARFLVLMEATEKRHHRAPRYSPGFFRRLASLARVDDRVLWIWCEHEGEPVASHIYFVESDTLIYWQGYFDKRFSYLRPNQHILVTTVREMAAAGIRRLNLGASPEDATGLLQYKERWGGKPFVYNFYSLKLGLGKLL